MEVKNLEFIPARQVLLHDASTSINDVEVSLYGQWTHIKRGNDVLSFPTSRIRSITWK